jgi:hypothetical protein
VTATAETADRVLIPLSRGERQAGRRDGNNAKHDWIRPFGSLEPRWRGRR